MDSPQTSPPVVIRDAQAHAPYARVDARGNALVILAVLAVLFTLKVAATFLIPLVVALLLTYALSPCVNFLVRRRCPRWIAAFVVLAVFFGGCGYGVYALRGQAQSIVDQVPTVVKKISHAIDSIDSGDVVVGKLKEATDALQKATDAASGIAPGGTTRVIVTAPGMTVKDYVMAGGTELAVFLGQAVMVNFLCFFLLQTGDKFKRKFVRIAGPTLSAKKISVQMFEQINRSIRSYMAMLLVTNLALAVATWGAFAILGVNNAGTWGVAAGVMHLVPYFGPFLIALATSIAAFMQFDSISMALLVGGTSLVLATLIGTVLTTWMTGRLARMNNVAVFVGFLAFGWLWGVWGVLLAVPLMVVLKVVCDHVESLALVSEFLGD